MVLEANRELSEQSLEGAEVIRETLILRRVKRTDPIRHLGRHSCELLREGGNHTIYVNRKGAEVFCGSAAS
jgi:hypothetical protein